MRKLDFLGRSKFTTAITLLLVWVFAGTIIFHIFEDWSLGNAFYFSVVTLTTIGFGDLVPTSDLTRFLASVYILGGVSSVLASLTIIGNTFIQQYQDRLERENLKLKKKVEVLSVIGDTTEKHYQQRLERENKHLRNIIKSIKTVIGNKAELEEKKK